MKTTTIIRNQKGFTLIELMVVAVILAIISAIAVPIYSGYKEEAQAQEAYLVLGQMADICLGKMIKAHETGITSGTAPMSDTTDLQYFVDISGTDCNLGGGDTDFTADGLTGFSVEGKDLVVTVSMDTNGIPSKVWTGSLY